ncbi:hypothetical protein SDRG_09789 [Saprolegnia diclina VS20]|uniref:Uncharacterized protein n=1 Tax=Saprolegnia diclina (strain VS20) TaxID=1156394 RepID=T0RQZ8_SAPDV|nr:hypothetical protein SDRG_09789 [Saprolegnia diclina VS20]EQC32462.1 hypothetical protein SDRG_09789 [Saprolegnia diclina VS20]|eukprot:XP_008613963.1 hypothetical protein SDRG_09789 [Saprolegnia diclina VS20]
MMATFRSVVIGQPDMAAIVFGYQFGVYEDVRNVFVACNELLEFDVRRRCYDWDASFSSTIAPGAAWAGEGHHDIRTSKYALDDSPWDARLPLHVAIVHGSAHEVKRIVRCRPDLASEDAILLAFSQHRLEIVELLLDLRGAIPELRRCCKVTADGSAQRTSYSVGSLVQSMLTYGDTKSVVLLQRFGLRPDDVTYGDKLLAIESSTLEHATLALDLFPWFHYPQLLGHVANRGFLPLVQALHERGFSCSTYAMDAAATNGHLGVVQFLHNHRTEGCTVKALKGAILEGHLDVARFLIEHRTEGAPPNYLHSLGTFDWTVSAVDNAVADGNLPVVQFLLTHRHEGCARDVVVQKALERCHLHVAEYLLALGYPFPTSMPFVGGFFFGKPCILGVLQLLVKHGASWDDAWMLGLGLVLFAGAPELRRLDELLHSAVKTRDMEAARFFLSAGIGKPRDCLLEIAGRRMHVTTSPLLLPYCMDATNPLDNVLFLLDLVALPDRRRSTILQLITPELTYQGKKANQTTPLARA